MLKSLERFVFSTNKSDLDGHKTLIKHAYRAFGITLMDADNTDCCGLTYRAKRSDDETTSITKWSMNVDNGPHNDTVGDKSIATIHLPQWLLNDYITAMAATRIAFLVFDSDILFSSANCSGCLGSVVVAARINCTVEKISMPITVTFDVSYMVSFME